MKIKYSDLRRVIKEEFVSARLVEQEPVLDVSDNLDALMKKFEATALSSLLHLGAGDHYNAQTHDYDDAAYQRAKTEAQTAAKHLRAKLAAALKEVWKSVHAGDRDVPKSGTFARPDAKKKVA